METEESQGYREAAADTTINHFVGKVSRLLVGLVYLVFLVELSEELALFHSSCWLDECPECLQMPAPMFSDCKGAEPFLSALGGSMLLQLVAQCPGVEEGIADVCDDCDCCDDCDGL